ncbi:MAG TPA: chorismate pyruvate-lyase family protein [Solirubrobacterales bacterium]|nr:chorismate pyruvate-lyase family protein [Solirubrobacterales bacterium]
MLTAEAQQIAHRHFLAQGERPDGVEEVEIALIEPFLRNLVFTDGTVTRALAVQSLVAVAVEQVEQAEVPAPALAAAHLDLEPGEWAVRRRVGIGAAERPPVIWAESHLVPRRLPPGFLGLLDGAPQGIGQSLQRFALESYRELLWFGLSSRPGWVEPRRTGERYLQRLYRIVSGKQAAILISETFAVREQAGRLHLAGFTADQPSKGDSR